ncbi:molybdopterin-dependent oxidoreductase [Kribbella sandramycini]|uniref:DMSO/TMAO reductase YedYZ molybdopterin-dependent catalytic subunit n=1 Tax=Kribbella sandramycini TaxID=60450 RepID=A0A7Y4L211_9ACTN|nr:molybdopterin-dependent oxidoreductase [Kribbella sandramycini]MBB6566446.1 DMSO/TMAO reductase YedYZ molybdopterin-dependent catalytic subunit [Kribbella sandramycini]NOL42895.1 molybdopterin-dependent oxidoreductase [Kribbella sandramycini]
MKLPAPPTAQSFRSPLHHPRVATVLGRWLGVAVLVCFLTGLFSHFQQESPAWLHIPTRPASLYRVTQGLHVLSGTVAVPLLLAKLWTVYPKLFEKPTLKTLLERLSILVLVSALALELFIGYLNTLQWYPWPFPFKQTHYALGWIIVGALLVHIAVKIPVIQWRKEPLPPATTDLTRRGLFRTVAGAATLVGITSVGQSAPPLGPLAVLAPRKPDVGPQGLPVNRTARDAGIDPLTASWRFTVVGPQQLSYTLDQLRQLPQNHSKLPIACVEGWSQGAHWEGIRIRDLLHLCGAPASSRVRVVSMEKGGFYATSELPPQFAADPLTLLALRLNGSELALDHGFPARIIAPNRPGVLQTKWVHRLEVLA